MSISQYQFVYYCFFYFQEAFRAFHPTTKLVSKYMPGLHIGKLAPDEVVKDKDIKKDFVELRKTAERMVCGCGSVCAQYMFSIVTQSWVVGDIMKDLYTFQPKLLKCSIKISPRVWTYLCLERVTLNGMFFYSLLAELFRLCFVMSDFPFNEYLILF